MNSIFKQRTCDLLSWSNEFFDEIFAQKPYRAIRVNPLKADLETVQSNFNFELKYVDLLSAIAIKYMLFML